MAKIKLPKKPHSLRLTPREKIELEVTHISLKTDVLRGLTLNFSRMHGDFIAGSPGEINYSERFQIVFKKFMCCD